MKTLILATVSAAALLSAGVASAQTATGVEAQFTSAQTALNALNVPTGERLRSYSSQTGNGNIAGVDQTGGGTAASENTSVVVQGWSTGKSNDNQAYVTQTGTGNDSVVMQRNYPEGNTGSNRVDVHQSGSNNNAVDYTYGNLNKANITQTGAGGGTAINPAVKTVADSSKGETYATSFHGADQTANHLTDDAAQVVQDEAINNSATINQGSNQSSATVAQWFGERNTATITQSTLSGFSSDNQRALIYQTQHDSVAGVSQTGASNSKAEIFQVSADQDGSAYGTVGADDSYSNNAAISQTNSYNSTATTLQAGHNNTASTTQSAYSDGSKAYTRQVGQYNEAYTNQGSGGGAFSQGTSLITQMGTSNYASVAQTGNLDSSIVTQTGAAANGYRGNSATVNQSGMSDISTVTQSGVNNSASVGQTAGNDYSLVNQTGTGLLNTAIINQNSANAVSIAYQNGANNLVNVHQH